MVKAIFIGKGSPLKSIALVTDDECSVYLEGKDMMYLPVYVNAFGVTTLYSRSWDVSEYKKLYPDVVLDYIHVKDYFCELTGMVRIPDLNLSRFEMANMVGVKVSGYQNGDPKGTAMTYWDIFNKLLDRK